MHSGSLSVSKKGNDVYMLPPAGVEHKHTLIFMHGLGDCADSFIPVFKDQGMSPFPLSTKVIILNAPKMKVTVNFGMEMNSWYDVKGVGSDLKDKYSREDVLKNAERVHNVMHQEIEEGLKGDAKKMWIGGFSQGGCMALHVGLAYPKTIGGIIACSCALFDISKAENEAEKK